MRLDAHKGNRMHIMRLDTYNEIAYMVVDWIDIRILDEMRKPVHIIK